MREIAAGVWRPPAPPIKVERGDPRFHEFASFWLEEKEADLDRSTFDDYRNLLTNHLLPAFHEKRLSEIDYDAIQEYRTARLREGARRRRASEAGDPLRGRHGDPLRPFGPRQVNASIRLLAQILDRALRSERFQLEHHRARDRDLKVRRDKPVYRRYLEADELLDLLDAALAIDQRSSTSTLELAETVRQLRDAERLPWKTIAVRIGRAESTAIWLAGQRPGGRRGRRAILATLGLSGLRAQEVAALRDRHLDFTHSRIVIDDGKTHASVREVHMSPFLREELRLFQASLRSPSADDLMFLDEARHDPHAPEPQSSRPRSGRRSRCERACRPWRRRAAASDHAAHAAAHLRDPRGAARPQRVVGAGADRARRHDDDAALLHAGVAVGDPAGDQAPRRAAARRVPRARAWSGVRASCVEFAGAPAGLKRSPVERSALKRCASLGRLCRLRNARAFTAIWAQKPPIPAILCPDKDGSERRRAPQNYRLCRASVGWRDPDSNRGHHDFQSCALPTELSRRAPTG